MRGRQWLPGWALLLVGMACANAFTQAVFIRTNQLGFLGGDTKKGIILSHENMNGKVFEVVRAQGDIPVFRGSVGTRDGGYGKFEFCHPIDFSPVTDPGVYRISIAGEVSYPFAIGDAFYNRVVDSLMLFFLVQRCGRTDPLLHAPCHLHDVTKLISRGTGERRSVEATGGWHDAGDYVKFLNTAAYTTYTLLFAYEFDPQAFGFDHDANGIPDILDEARIGLRWLLKLNLGDGRLITQVQDLRDHDQGWRRPEDDELERDRPGFVGMGKNLTGIYCATMASAYRIWTERGHDPEFAGQCLTAAENLYSLRNNVPNIDTSGTGMYRDISFAGKMALGAVELFLATGQRNYLRDAKEYATAAGSDYWWSWGDINSYAHYRLAPLDKKFRKYLQNNLVASAQLARRHAFGEAGNGNWGSNNSILGVALQAILWKRLTGETVFDTLLTQQRDFILGMNPWGVSFIYGIGANYSKHLHSQVGYFRGGYLPGALAAGPVTVATQRQYPLSLERPDPYDNFQSESSVYHDDRMDYVTNEPTIAAAATAVFVMGYFSHEVHPPMER
jgi:endoglucanase